MNHKCPNCKITFYGTEEVEKKVGFRVMNGIRYVQSWCKKCRSKKLQEQRLSRN